jgi:hypothetical protein
MRKTMLALTAAVALCAFGAQAASAEWYDKGTALKSGENPTLEVTGTVAFTSSGGGVHCNTGTSKMQFTGGTTDGHVLTFTVEEPSKCEVSGGLVFLTGGTTTLRSVTLTGTPTEKQNSDNEIHISAITLHNEFNNGFKLTLSSVAGSPLVVTPNNTTSISSATLSGELNSTLAAGKVAVSGSLNVLAPNVGTYGLVS